MNRNRLPSAAEAVRLPQPPPPPAASGSFMLCPAGLGPAQEALYRWALEQAQQAARPSIPERDLAGVWN